MEKYGLFGDRNTAAAYCNYEIPDVKSLPALIGANPELRGINVTIPHKQAVIPLLDEMSDEARAIGAVNVVRITRKRSTT